MWDQLLSEDWRGVDFRSRELTLGEPIIVRCKGWTGDKLSGKTPLAQVNLLEFVTIFHHYVLRVGL